MVSPLASDSNRFYERFGRAPVVLPVIHVLDEHQALSNARVAEEGGCPGVFLINHQTNSEHLFGVWRRVRKAFPNLWLGLNCLDLRPFQLHSHLPDGIAGIWVDDGQIDERQIEQSEAAELQTELAVLDPSPIHFGGVAFKYQRPVTDLTRACALAAPLMDVVTTSGERTGEPAELGKVQQMRAALGEHPLALASGVDESNIGDFARAGANCFLVASSITGPGELIDEIRLADLLGALY